MLSTLFFTAVFVSKCHLTPKTYCFLSKLGCCLVLLASSLRVVVGKREERISVILNSLINKIKRFGVYNFIGVLEGGVHSKLSLKTEYPLDNKVKSPMKME